VAAEADDSDPVLALQIAMGEGRRRTHCGIERAAAAAAHVREGVQEENDVRVPLRMLLVYPERPAPRARPPVDAADTVSGRILPQVRELDSVSSRARHLVPDEHLRLERSEQRVQRL